MNKAVTRETILKHLEATLRSRLPAQGGDPNSSYVAKLYTKGPDAFLKKVGEEATEFVMAAKDSAADRIINEAADLWFHTLVALTYYGLSFDDILDELVRREGLSGLQEKASRTDV